MVMCCCSKITRPPSIGCRCNYGYLKGVIGDLIVLLPPQENPALSRLADMPYEVLGNLGGWLENLRTDNIRFQAGSGRLPHFVRSFRTTTDRSGNKFGYEPTLQLFETNRADLIRWMSVTSDGSAAARDSLLAQPLPFKRFRHRRAICRACN